MELNTRVAYSDFNEESNRQFFSLFNEFSNAADSLDKDTRESALHSLRAQYLSQLKQKLDKIGHAIMGKSDNQETLGRLRINFSERTTFLIKEFKRKSGLI